MSITINHSLVAGGKQYTFSIGGAGCEKRVTRIPKLINKEPIQIYGFGQDSLGIFKTDTQLLLSLADGHGPKEEGKTISYKIHEYMLTYIAESSGYILSNLRTNDYESINKLIIDMFEHVNQIILKHDEVTSKFMCGGSTFTMIHKIIDEEDGSLYSLSYNVGDSPYFKISLDGVVEELSEEHNCDNIATVEQYYNHCLETGVGPSPIILGRFNFKNFYKATWMGSEPINPYNVEVVDGKYKLSKNTDIMKKFYEKAPVAVKGHSLYNGGTQSIRGREANLKAIANGEYPMENFGSTIGGDVQNVNSFGDKKSILAHNIICNPHISITKIEASHYDFVGSDGPMDCLTNSDISAIFKSKPLMDTEEFTHYVRTTVDEKALEGGFNFSIFGNVPTWDDNSFWVVETKIEDTLDTKLLKLEKEHLELNRIATRIKLEIDTINKAIDRLE
jgi:serine/threonine protein phosphatase PrpC